MHIERSAILIILVLLLGIGLVMIYNSSAVLAGEQEKYQNDPMYFLKRQLVWMFFGIGTLLVMANTDYELLLKYSPWLLGAAFILLCLVFVPGIGVERNGARRWIGFGGATIQPSELAKYTLIFYLAHYLSLKQRKLKRFTKGFLPPLGISALLIAVIFMQPNLSTALVMSAITLILMFAAGSRIKHILIVGGACVTMAALLVGMLFVPVPHPKFEAFQTKAKNKLEYQWNRIDALINMEEHKSDIAYQPYQSLIGIGSGGTKGVGLARGKQKYYYLPFIYNDFVGSIIGEELGFIGLSSVIFAYAALAMFGFRIALKCKQTGGYLVAVGVTSLLALHALIHIGVVSGMLPVTGLNLPFISYGGSNLLMNFFGIAVLMSISKSNERRPKSKLYMLTARKKRR